MVYASELIVTMAIGIARWSILLFYARIFTTRSFRSPLWSMYILNGAWTIAFTLVYIFQCSNPSEFWKQQWGTKAKCVDVSVNYYYAVSSIIIDVLMLSIPWPPILKLKMEVKQKVAVISIFMLGGV